jgi:hypothetical protein
MKTAEQFLEECKARWKQTDPNMQSEVGAKQALIEALILYAEQAIDTCAESAEATESGYYSEDVYLSSCYVDKQSILNVKKLLK